ncbi:hypothetical protein OAA42_00720 [Pelagibacteraceae bacterium]|nr:hypothetical protein [Pelagibacteraceae bacterium]MDC0413267.1 hypothetical protein [Pelagibacteraceae bacterium]
MNYLISTICLFGFYKIGINFSAYYYKSKTNILQNIFSFTLVFYLIYIITSYFFIFQISSKFISAGMAILSFVLGISFLLKKYKIILKEINNNFNHKLLLLSIFSYFLLSYLIPSDQDSIRYHLEIPKNIIENTFYKNSTLDYMMVGANEFIILFGLHLNFENTASLLSFTYIIFIILTNNFFLEKYKIGSKYLGGIIVISSPYLISLIASQKIYLLPCFIVSYSIAYLYIAKNKISFKDILLIIVLNIFSVCLKTIFLPYLLYILFWSLFIFKSTRIEKIYISLFSLFVGCLSYLPIGWVKYQLYKDPFIPIVSFNPDNQEWLKMWYYYLTNFQMDYTDRFNRFVQIILIPIKLIVPLSPTDLFRTLGIGMAGLLLLPYKKNKNLLLIVFFFLVSFFILGNYQSRWLLPLLIFIGIFVQEIGNNFFKKIVYLQLICILFVVTPLGLWSFFGNYIPKINIAKKIAPIRDISQKINEKYKNQKYFTNTNSFYYHDNKIPIYYPEITKIYDKDLFNRNKNVRLFLHIDSGKFDISQYVKGSQFQFPKYVGFALNKYPEKNSRKVTATCANSGYQIMETWRFNVRRFFLFPAMESLTLYRLC